MNTNLTSIQTQNAARPRKQLVTASFPWGKIVPSSSFQCFQLFSTLERWQNWTCNFLQQCLRKFQSLLEGKAASWQLICNLRQMCHVRNSTGADTNQIRNFVIMWFGIVGLNCHLGLNFSEISKNWKDVNFQNNAQSCFICSCWCIPEKKHLKISKLLFPKRRRKNIPMIHCAAMQSWFVNHK